MGRTAATITAPLVLLLCSSAMACSGPGGLVMIAVNQLHAVTMAAAAIPLGLLAVAAPARYRSQWFINAAAVGLIFAWLYCEVMHGYTGDCGRLMRMQGLRGLGLAAGAAHVTWMVSVLSPRLRDTSYYRVSLAAVLAPFAAAACFTIAGRYLGDFSAGGAWHVLGGWLAGVAGFTALQLVPWQAMTEQWKRRYAGMCPTCHYDLRGSPGPHCPECGDDISVAVRSVPDRSAH